MVLTICKLETFTIHMTRHITIHKTNHKLSQGFLQVSRCSVASKSSLRISCPVSNCLPFAFCVWMDTMSPVSHLCLCISFVPSVSHLYLCILCPLCVASVSTVSMWLCVSCPLFFSVSIFGCVQMVLLCLLSICCQYLHLCLPQDLFQDLVLCCSSTSS